MDLAAPLEVARWRPLVHWFLAIPQWIVLYVLQLVLLLLGMISWFIILLTTHVPPGLFDFMAMILRYQWRVYSYVGFMRESYPPFDFTPGHPDPGTDPARLSVEYPERMSRWLIFAKWVIVIPHLIVLVFVGIAAFFVGIAGFFAVLITGRWPQGMRDFLIGFFRWNMRVSAYFHNMTDRYPPFRLSE